jgi:DNA-binding transcriptional MerR regulator
MKERGLQFTLDELCALVEMNKRKIRYYIQKGLVDRPVGTGKGAFYGHRHVEQLLTIRKWKDAGLSLERIQELLGGESQEMGTSGQVVPPPRPKKAGAVEVWSHLYIADGVELQIEPQRSGLTPEQVRALCRMIMHAYEQVQQGEE